MVAEIVEQVAGDRATRVETTQSSQIFQWSPEFVEFRPELGSQLLASAVGVLPHLAHSAAQPGRRRRQTLGPQDQQPGDDEDQELAPADVENPHAPPRPPQSHPSLANQVVSGPVPLVRGSADCPTTAMANPS